MSKKIRNPCRRFTRRSVGLTDWIPGAKRADSAYNEEAGTLPTAAGFCSSRKRTTRPKTQKRNAGFVQKREAATTLAKTEGISLQNVCSTLSISLRFRYPTETRLPWDALYAEMRAHLESQFKDGMAWDNYGDVWEFDHIVPYKAFPTVEELDKHHKIVCWYKNVRPLPPPDNRSDGGNYKEEDKQALIRRYQLWEIEREVLALI